MPVYEYFCPRCSRELEVLRPIKGANEYSDCPNCGGKAWRLVSSFGAKTGSYLQPSGEPFRGESEWQASSSQMVKTVTKSEIDAGSLVDDQQTSSAVEMSWLLESQPNGSNIWFIQDWGIASILRYLREDLGAEIAQVAARPVEAPVDLTSGVDRRTEYPSVRPWPDELMAEPAKATEPDAISSDVPRVAYVEPRAVNRSKEPAKVTGLGSRAKRAPARQRILKSYFGWFVLILVSISVIVVLLVWILTMAA